MEQLNEYKHITELLTTGVGTEGQLLIPRKIHDILIAESEKALIPRSEAALYLGPANIPGSSVDIDLESENKMTVRITGEGAEIVLDEDEYTSVNLKPVKYGVSIKITKEMQEDSKFPLLERNIKKAGKKLAENETSLIITALDGASTTTAGGAAITISNIAESIFDLDQNDKTASTLFVGNEVVNDLRLIDTFAEANKFGNRDMQEKGMVGTIYGLNVIRFSTNAAPSTTYAKYAYVTDKDECYAIAEKRPITVENFTLPQYDMSGAAITQRLKVSLLRSTGVSKITTS